MPDECDHSNNNPDMIEEYDLGGLFLCRTCPACRSEKLRGFRPEILDDDQREAAGYPPSTGEEPSYNEVIEEPIDEE